MMHADVTPSRIKPALSWGEGLEKEHKCSTAEVPKVSGLMAGSRFQRASVVNQSKQWRTT
jgi:hypothetical protein